MGPDPLRKRRRGCRIAIADGDHLEPINILDAGVPSASDDAVARYADADRIHHDDQDNAVLIAYSPY